MNQRATPHDMPSTEKLDKALRKNKQVTKEVQDAADDLAVVHAVLDTEVPKQTLPEDVDRAIERAGELEKTLSDSAKHLQEVNRALENQLDDRLNDR
jgi:chaperonin cofactor prefoldin